MFLQGTQQKMEPESKCRQRHRVHIDYYTLPFNLIEDRKKNASCTSPHAKTTCCNVLGGKLGSIRSNRKILGGACEEPSITGSGTYYHSFITLGKT